MVARKSIITLILLTLIAFKVSAAAIHVSSHHGEEGHEDHCELCEQAIYNQLLEFSTPMEFQEFESIEKLQHYQQVRFNKNVRVSTFFDTALLVRPPPSFI